MSHYHEYESDHETFEEGNEEKNIPNIVTRFPCKNNRCDQDVIREGVNDFYCSRECYHIKLELNNLESEGKSIIFKHISIKGRGGTGLLEDKKSLDHLLVQVNDQFGRVVRVHNSGANAIKWRKSETPKRSAPDKAEKQQKEKDEEKDRLKALLNMDFEDSSDEENGSDKSIEDKEAFFAEAHEEIQALLSSDVNSNVCPLHPPLISVSQRGKRIKAYTINVISPWEIYVQTIDMIKKTHQIDTICNRPEGVDHRMILRDWYPVLGGHCSAKFEDKFYRAKLLKQIDDSYEVKFIDYGNTDIVSTSDLRQLDPEVTLIPRQCIYFKISNVKPKEGSRWGEQVCNFTVEHLDGASVELELDTVEQQIIHLGKLRVLHSISGSIHGDFGTALIKKYLAQPDSYFIS